MSNQQPLTAEDLAECRQWTEEEANRGWSKAVMVSRLLDEVERLTEL